MELHVGSTDLSRPLQGALYSCASLAIVSAAAFIALQYVKISFQGNRIPLGQLYNNAFSITAATTFVATSVAALSILGIYTYKKRHTPPSKNSEASPPAGSEETALRDTAQQRARTNGGEETALQDTAQQGAPSNGSVELDDDVFYDCEPELTQTTTQPTLMAFLEPHFATFTAFTEAMKKQERVDVARLETQSQKLRSLLQKVTSFEHFRNNIAAGVLNELKNYVYFAKESSWKKQSPIDYELEGFDRSLNDTSLFTILDEARSRAKELHYPYLAALGERILEADCKNFETLRAKLRELAKDVTEALYTVFLEEIRPQVEELFGLPLYLSGYLTMWQGYYIYEWAYSLGVTGYYIRDLVKNSPKNPSESNRFRAGIKEKTNKICSAQLKARAPSLIDSELQTYLGELMDSVVLPILNVAEGKASLIDKKKRGDACDYQVNEITGSPFAKALTSFFRKSNFTPKEEYLPLHDDSPFAKLSAGVNVLEKVQALVEAINLVHSQ